MLWGQDRLSEKAQQVAFSQADAVELEALVESLLFVADQPVTAGQLAEVLEVDETAIKEALATLDEGYVEGERGLRIQRQGEQVQLVTAPEAGPHVQRFLGLELSGPLSQAAVYAWRKGWMKE